MLDTMVAYLWPEASSSLSFVGNELDPARGQMGLDLIFPTRDGYITAGSCGSWFERTVAASQVRLWRL